MFEPKKNIYVGTTLATQEDLDAAIKQFMHYTGTVVSLTFPNVNGSAHEHFRFIVVYPSGDESTDISGYFHCDMKMTEAERYSTLYSRLVNDYFNHSLWFLNVINLKVVQETKPEPKKIKFKPLPKL